MLFNSYTFFIFLASVLIVSRILKNWSARKGLLLVASYFFYAAWNPPFVLILWTSTIVDWYVSKHVYISANNLHRKGLILISLIVNMGMLSYFKYGNFMINNLNAVFEKTGIHWSMENMSIVLPVGISFYTFQTLSYTLDVYRKKMSPSRSFLDYALYVTFFPQLVAGPIVRASEFLPQCIESRKGSGAQIGWGMCLFVIGLFCKVVLADHFMSPIVEMVYTGAPNAGFITAWTGTIAFAMQIFYDFFGYSTCAIGVALSLGFEIPDNFHFPYAARGFSDFWRRWHISLSSWLRDYLYFPLGGNRKGIGRTYVNLMLTMLIGGLWHGASWMFVIWGGLHGIYLCVERVLSRSKISKWPFWRGKAGDLIIVICTFLLVCLTWVFFRAENLSSALYLCNTMTNPYVITSTLTEFVSSGFSIPSVDPNYLTKLNYLYTLVIGGSTVLMHYLMRNTSLEEFFGSMPFIWRSLSFALMIFFVFISISGVDDAFIYFQF